MPFTRGAQSHIDPKSKFITRNHRGPTKNCKNCGDSFPKARYDLGYRTCLQCGSPRKTYAAVPVPKSNYVIATCVEQLHNPYSHKGTK